jgi:hypothetical protein
MTNGRWLLLWTAALVALAACAQAPTCPPEQHPIRYLDSAPPSSEAIAAPEPAVITTEVEIGGRLMKVDRVVEGQLCHDHWQGTVYVGCDVEVVRWDEQPLFLKDCDFSVEPGSVVYGASHNDAAYYNGCSCHTGEDYTATK